MIGGGIAGATLYIVMRTTDPPQDMRLLTELFNPCWFALGGGAFAGLLLSLIQLRNPLLLGLSLVGTVLVVLGFSSWTYGFVVSEGISPWTDQSDEFPLGDLEEIVVDSKGRIYTADRFYSRVQMYDRSGRFVRGWFMSAGQSNIHLDTFDRLSVHARAELRIYSGKGKLLSTKDVGPQFQLPSDGEKFRKRDAAGNLYQAEGVLFPHVIKVTPGGQQKQLVSVPWSKWFWMGPLPAWLFGAVGILCLGLVEWLKKVAALQENQARPRKA